MTVKEELYQLVDQLPDEESHTAIEFLKNLCQPNDVSAALHRAPPDAEPLTAQEAAESEAAWKAYREGRDTGKTLAKIRQELL